MREVGALEAKNTFGTLLDWVAHGEEVLITRRGKPVARLVASAAPTAPDQARAAALRIKARAVTAKVGSFDWTEWKAYRDEGRR
jgi:prevent-host-death family protein